MRTDQIEDQKKRIDKSTYDNECALVNLPMGNVGRGVHRRCPCHVFIDIPKIICSKFESNKDMREDVHITYAHTHRNSWSRNTSIS